MQWCFTRWSWCSGRRPHSVSEEPQEQGFPGDCNNVSANLVCELSVAISCHTPPFSNYYYYLKSWDQSDTIMSLMLQGHFTQTYKTHVMNAAVSSQNAAVQFSSVQFQSLFNHSSQRLEWLPDSHKTIWGDALWSLANTTAVSQRLLSLVAKRHRLESHQLCTRSTLLSHKELRSTYNMWSFLVAQFSDVCWLFTFNKMNASTSLWCHTAGFPTNRPAPVQLCLYR